MHYDIGAKVIQWDNPRAPETQWFIRPVSEFATPGRVYTIQSKSARGKFLNVDRASYDNGAELHVRARQIC